MTQRAHRPRCKVCDEDYPSNLAVQIHVNRAHPEFSVDHLYDGTEPCVGAAETFFPTINVRKTYTQIVARAKQHCMACPKRAACLEAAHIRLEVDGVWGGRNFDEDQPNVINRRRKAERKEQGA